MLCNLERHILTLNNFRINVATPLDFALHFCFLEQEILKVKIGCIELEPELILDQAVSQIHYAVSQYRLSRKKYSSIAVAVICSVLQDIHNDGVNDGFLEQNGPQVEMNDGQICEMQYRRDQFLISIFQKYPQLDVDEIFEVLKDLREQVVQFFAR